ncbi:TCR/Tet family MFS transporter [Oceanomicrobium pacificus]|uniref:MFS transporter n=1 Tax=Oceanomicrobium pacificus TaxID=2692916 RepID=A0A6B0TUK8_9RHOB|nr:TCR/Tet family MFS transporter [Oceanomicrobium pacificus]MXU65278.1 MFS transporter [Oceanomicrobium pacificus]
MTNRKSLIFIIATVTIDAIGIGLILPVLPELIAMLLTESISAAALWGGWLIFTYALMQFIFGPVLGGLSDRFGRRPVLLASLFVMGLDYLLMAVAGSIWLLFVARTISGIAGATHATATAYLADITPPEKRAANFGLVGAAFGIGFIVGPAIGGLLGTLGPQAPFLAAALLAFANATFGWFVAPETLAPEKRRAFDWRRANPFGALLRVRHFPVLAGLVLVFFLFNLALFVYPAIWAYFTIERFAWSTGMVGLSLATYGLLAAFVQGFLIRIVLAKLGERRTAIFGLVMEIVGLVIIAFVTNGIWIFILMPITALGNLAGPALQGMMSNRVGDDEQGELQGLLASVASVGTIFSPLMMTGLFRIFTYEGAAYYMPGAPFLLAAFLTVICLMVLTRIKRLTDIVTDSA